MTDKLCALCGEPGEMGYVIRGGEQDKRVHSMHHDCISALRQRIERVDAERAAAYMENARIQGMLNKCTEAHERCLTQRDGARQRIEREVAENTGCHEAMVTLLTECGELRIRIERVEAERDDWLRVFGHLSKDADEAGNLINEARNTLTRELDEAREALRELLEACDLKPGFDVYDRAAAVLAKEGV